MSRALLPASDLRLGHCPTPRPSDRVTWFQDRNRYVGTLIGHDMHGRPRIRTQFDTDASAESFDCLRLADDAEPAGPNWTRLSEHALVVQPTEEERKAFERLLSQRTPPGPRYEDLVSEITFRGYETYVVGGTVRDVINGTSSNDVDLVTSMPLEKALPLVRSMYGGPQTLRDSAKKNGHLRPGGDPRAGDPYIDLSVFKHSFIGTQNAIFSDDFGFDVRNRDFACNAIYYDPLNRALIDPTGLGIADVTSRVLRLVNDARLRAPGQLGRIFIRCVKFMCKGFSPAEELERQLGDLIQHLASLDAPIRANYIRTQILSKGDGNGRKEEFERFHAVFIEIGGEEHWKLYIEPIREVIL